MATLVSTEAPHARSRTTESCRVWLFKTLFTNLCGITFGDWREALRENHYAVDPSYWPRAAILTAGSLLNSLYRSWEDRGFEEQLANVRIQPPVFILGHWRSGTTLLHNLLALDDQFAYPNLYQVFFPHTFLTTEEARTNLVRPLIPQTRIFDNVAQGLQMPNEDEFATCTSGLRSPYMAWSFPRHHAFYERFLTFRDAAPGDLTRWRNALDLFLKKLTLKHDRPILLKSPPHTCRIKLLLEMFPDARFLHIRPNPYTVFQSTSHLVRVLTRSLQFQHRRREDLDSMVLRRYQVMYDAYFEECSLIPENRLHDLAFEDLEADPVGQVRSAYEALELSGFEELQPRLEDYVDSLADYRKNDYPALPAPVRRRIDQAWARSFDQWDYPRGI